jgi:MEMO1 family protein
MRSVLTALNGTVMLLALICTAAQAQTTRPVRDDVGFSWRAGDMDSLMAYLSRNAGREPEAGGGLLIGGISPHDDYLYAGPTYYPLFKNLRTKEVVIIGLVHGTVRKEMNNPHDVLIFDEYERWPGPYGPVLPSPLREFLKARLPKADFMVSNKAHDLEHSIEALIPFMQYHNRDVRITPIMVSTMDLPRMEELGNRLAELFAAYIAEKKLKLGEDIAFLISTDANHYGADFNNTSFGDDEAAHRKATENDRRIADTYLNGEISAEKTKRLADEIRWDSTGQSGRPLWCGRYPVAFGLMTIAKTVDLLHAGSVNGVLLKYSDTWTGGVLPLRGTHMGLTAPFSLKHWVGFFSAGLYVKNPN